MSRMRQLQGHAGPRRAARFRWALPLLLMSLVGCAEEPTAATDPKAAELFHQAVASLESQPRFRVLVDFAGRTKDQGETTETKTTHRLSIERPNRLAIWPQGEEKGEFVVSDGKQYWRGNSITRKYTTGQSPPTLQDIINDFSNDTDLGVQGLPFVSQDGYDELIEQVTESRDLGVESVEEHACQHLHFAGDKFTFDVWLEKSTPWLIRKLAFDCNHISVELINEAGEIETVETDSSLSLGYQFRDWQLDPDFSENEFAFVPPDDWEKTDGLADSMAEAEEGPNPLLGKAAPDFELETRGGEMAGIAEHRDKEVVILDFWATWCGPCRESLPTIAKVAAEYRDRGVVFYAINLKQGPEEVEKLLAESQLDIPVLFDRDGAVAKLYYVEGIPQTVLIGKDGTVQVVHVGMLPDGEAQLSEELDDLLAGKTLATESEEPSETNKTGPADEPASGDNML